MECTRKLDFISKTTRSIISGVTRITTASLSLHINQRQKLKPTDRKISMMISNTEYFGIRLVASSEWRDEELKLDKPRENAVTECER